MRNLKYIYLLVFITLMSSCLTPDFPIVEGQNDLNTTNFPMGFDWTTEKNISINLEQKVTDEILNLNLYYLDNDNKMILGNFNLDNQYASEITLTIPKDCNQIYLQPLNSIYKDALEIDVYSNINLKITKESFTQLRKSNNIIYTQNAGSNKTNITFSYMDGYNSMGVPNNLLKPRDLISQSLINDINASLPESRPVNIYNPEYITTQSLDTKILSKSEVWITFVTEGAGWRNSIGYYTYDLNSPPKSVNDINNLTVIFPNSSLSGSGGGLTPGDKIKLGLFPPNTGIGWVLFPNGWDGLKVVSSSEMKFSNPQFNTFTASQYSQHMVFLSDEIRNIILLGFEDISRPGGDNDFNDAIFYITANPFEAIDISSLTNIKKSIDTDKDGIQDYLDSFPLDPNLSSVEYYPSINTYSGLAFEDMWPAKGDYDFNDLVLDFKYTLKKNANNKIAEIECEYNIKAIGGAYRNGFAISLNCDQSVIKSVSGNEIPQNVFKLNSNGTEFGISKAVIPIFENAYDVFKLYNNGFINTEKSKEKYAAKKITINIKFNTPQSISEIGSLPFDPFIVVNQKRGSEIHLPLKNPTIFANTELFNTLDDNSKASGYYLTSNNLPWAILTTGSFEYPIEKAPINSGHLKFTDWALSKGLRNNDWYKNLSTYRNTKNIY